MCQMRGPAPPTPYGEPTPSPINSALALYPNLRSDTQQVAPSQSDPNLHLAGILVPGAAEAFGRVWTSKVPGEFMAPQPPLILPLPGRRLAPLVPRPVTPAPALPAPIGGPLFKPVNPGTDQTSPPPFPAPPPAGPTLSPPSKQPPPLEPERILPDDIAKAGGQIVGGGFSVPEDPHAPLPGFSILDEDDPARALVLEMEISRGRLLPNGRRILIPRDHDKLQRWDDCFGLADEIYQKAGRLVTKTGGKLLGIEWHRLAKEVLEGYGESAKGVRAEISYIEGREAKYSVKDTARVDLVWTREDGTVVIVDLKTGGATLSAAQIAKIVKNVTGKPDGRVFVYQYKP